VNVLYPARGSPVATTGLACDYRFEPDVLFSSSVSKAVSLSSLFEVVKTPICSKRLRRQRLAYLSHSFFFFNQPNTSRAPKQSQALPIPPGTFSRRLDGARPRRRRVPKSATFSFFHLVVSAFGAPKSDAIHVRLPPFSRTAGSMTGDVRLVDRRCISLFS